MFLNQDEHTYVEPDLSVICDKSKLDDRGCNGAPDWVIEIVSPSSQRMDYMIKLFKYRDAGVREYWITMISWEILNNNPCHHMKLPKNERKDPPHLTKNEFFDFVKTLDNIPREKLDYKIAFMLALFCGLRRGEVCGLER